MPALEARSDAQFAAWNLIRLTFVIEYEYEFIRKNV